MCASKKSKFERVKKGISIVGVQQIYRVLEVVEETLEGHEVRLLNCNTLPALDLPKKLTGTEGILFLNLGWRNKYSPKSTAMTWNGVT